MQIVMDTEKIGKTLQKLDLYIVEENDKLNQCIGSFQKLNQKYSSDNSQKLDEIENQLAQKISILKKNRDHELRYLANQKSEYEMANVTVLSNVKNIDIE